MSLMIFERLSQDPHLKQNAENCRAWLLDRTNNSPFE